MSIANTLTTLKIVPSPFPVSAKRKPVKQASVQVAESIFDDQPARISIEVRAGAMGEVVDQSIAALIETGLVFDRGGVLIGIDRNNSVHQMNAATIQFAVSKLAIFVKTTLIKGQVVTETVNIPSYVGVTIAALTAWPGMPHIDAITDHPFLTLKGRLVGSGHDNEMKTFGRFEAAAFNVLANPTREEAVTALVEVRRLLQTFEFETEGDEAAALAAMLTAVSRPALATALLTLIDAPMSGSGKGYLGALLARLAQNLVHTAKLLPDDSNEIHKVIVSALIAAEPVCFFDELAMTEIDCPAIRTLATAEIYGARLLGVMRQVKVSTKVFVVATGNNVSASADTARRMLHLRLNPMCENPSLRNFAFDAEADMAKNRNYFVSQLLTIQRAFLLAHEQGETAKPMQAIGGFKAWDLLCRQPIMWLISVDPCSRMLKTMKSNPAKNDLLTIMFAWRKSFGSTPTKSGDALKSNTFRQVCEETIKRKPGSQISAISLGLWIKKHRGQVINGQFFTEDAIDTATGVQYWKVSET